MGCGKSKESVATENTITVKKLNSRQSKDIQTVNGAKEEKNVKDSSLLGENNVEAVGEVKDISEDNELKKINKNETEEEIVSKESPKKDEGNEELKKIDEEIIISKESPRKDEIITSKESPRKDEEVEFFSPHIGSGKETLFTNPVKPDDHAHQKMLLQETQNVAGETPIKEEENVVKETKEGTSLESQVSSPQAETMQKAQEEKVAVDGSEGSEKKISE